MGLAFLSTLNRISVKEFLDHIDFVIFSGIMFILSAALIYLFPLDLFIGLGSVFVKYSSLTTFQPENLLLLVLVYFASIFLFTYGEVLLGRIIKYRTLHRFSIFSNFDETFAKELFVNFGMLLIVVLSSYLKFVFGYRILLDLVAFFLLLLLTASKPLIIIDDLAVFPAIKRAAKKEEILIILAEALILFFLLSFAEWLSLLLFSTKIAKVITVLLTTFFIVPFFTLFLFELHVEAYPLSKRVRKIKRFYKR